MQVYTVKNVYHTSEAGCLEVHLEDSSGVVAEGVFPFFLRESDLAETSHLVSIAVDEYLNSGGQIETKDQEEAAPIPPPPLTFLQLMIGLVAEGWITEAEGDAWLDGTPPPQVDALISQLPAEERFPARARAKRFTIAEREDPLVNGLGQIEGKTPEDLDAFFHQYSQI